MAPEDAGWEPAAGTKFQGVIMSEGLGWSPSEEAKIQEIMKTDIIYEGCKPYKPERPEAIRIMRRLFQSGKWKPEENDFVQTV